MSDYQDFARFYDDVLGDLQPNSTRVLAAIETYLPLAASLLELGSFRHLHTPPLSTRWPPVIIE